MDTEPETNWYAVHSKARREDLAAAGVTELGVEVFLPRIKREVPVGGNWREVAWPLFPGYFFTRFNAPVLLDAILRVRGVLNVVGNSHFPIPLAEEVIAEIQQRVRTDGFIHLESKSLSPGDQVKIESGPCAGWIGRVERELDGNQRVSILLDVLQQSRVLVNKRALTLLAPRA